MDITYFDAQLQRTPPLDESGIDRLVAGRLEVSNSTSESELREFFSQYLGQRMLFALLETERQPENNNAITISVIRIWESELPMLDIMYPGYTLHPAQPHTQPLPRLRPPLSDGVAHLR